MRWCTSGSALPATIFSRFSSVRGGAVSVAESSSYRRPVLAETVKVRSAAEPPVGVANDTGSGWGADELSAVQVPAAWSHVQPRGFPLSGQWSAEPYFRPTTIGLSFWA